MFKLLIRKYNFREVEAKWQEIWGKNPLKKQGKKFYCLSMFPYPSGSLHIGHVRVYSISDSVSRFESLRGKNVLHPMGWDAFGLPAENAAIERKIPADVWTFTNISQMKSQLLRLGFSFDWDREIETCSPDYYKWTQHIFLMLYKRGLAYQKEGYINWDPIDKTVLANEQVDEKGRSWRSGALVERKLLKQWYFKITKYAEELINGLSTLDWPEEVIETQKGWIGKTTGLSFFFETNYGKIEVFTTRVETVMGVTFLGLAPEHEFAKYATEEETHKINTLKSKSEVSRKIGKDSVLLSKVKAFHPFTNEILPVVICEYIIIDAGTGAVMGVPAHNSSDLGLATQKQFPIVKVIENDKIVNSGEFDGLTLKEAAGKISEKLGCRTTVNFRLKDWLVSRQRYWGVPIPIIHCRECGPVPEESLPLELPKIENKEQWLNTNCPKCGQVAKRDPDTLDTFVDSSWYYLRYIDSKNPDKLCDKNAAEVWAPVDIYIGGIEHAIMHLLYARFVHKVMRDCQIVSYDEPFIKLLTQGLVLGLTYKYDGKYLSTEEAKDVNGVEKSFEKMSKSKKNGVSPEDIIEVYGADVLRLSILFAAPSEKEIRWDGNLLKTMRRWLVKISNLPPRDSSGKLEVGLVRDITDCMVLRKFHVAIARLMEYTQILTKNSEIDLKYFLIMLHPFAPHISSELFQKHYGEDIRSCEWPKLN